MKNSIFIVIPIIILNALVLNAQDFAKIGTKWTYNDLNYFTGKYVPVYYEVTGKKEIKGKSCNIIEKKDYKGKLKYNEFFYQQESKVYFYHENLDTFFLLFDFDAKVDDTLDIGLNYPSLSKNEAEVKVVIDSIGNEIFCDTIFKVWYIRLLDSYNYSFDNKVIEKIGFMTSFHPRFGLDDSAEGNLRCYSNNDISCSFYDFDCDAIVEELSTFQTFKDESFELYPNPAKDVININYSGGQDIKAVLTFKDIIGKVILKKEVLMKKNNPINIDVSSYKTGLYFVSLEDEEGSLIKTLKLVINHNK